MDVPSSIDIKNEQQLLVSKIHKLLNKFQEKTGYTVAEVHTEYERKVNVIHYCTELTLFLDDENGNLLPKG